MKPSLSPGAKRALVLVLGLLGTALSALAEAFKDNPSVTWQALLAIVASGAAGLATKWPGDKDQSEIAKLVEELAEKVAAEILGRYFPRSRPVNVDDTLRGLGPQAGGDGTDS